MVLVINSHGVLQQAPDFPGWKAMGLETILLKGDRIVNPFGDLYNIPLNGILAIDILIGKRANFLCNNDKRYCVYRQIESSWVQITSPSLLNEKPRMGDVFLRNGNTDPDLVPKEDPEGNRYGFTVLSLGDGWNPLIDYSKVYTFWRKSSNAAPIHRLPGNKHHSEPLPLP